MSSSIRAALLLLPLALVGCNRTETANGPVTTTQQRDVQPFTRINVQGGIRVTLTTGQRNVAITGSQNLLANVDLTVEDGVLMVRAANGVTLEPARSVTLQVSNDVLQGAEVSGNSQLTADATRADEWTLKASATSAVAISRIDASRLNIDASTGARIDVFGTATDIDVKVSGVSRVNAQGVSAMNVRVDASDDAELLLNASGSATGNASGRSTVNVAGNPQTQSIESSGAAQVTYDALQ